MHIGDWLRTSRREAGISVEEATFRLRALPRTVWVSTKTVHRAETNPDPDPVLAAALATVCGKHRDEWPTELQQEADQLQHVLGGVAPGSGPHPPAASLGDADRAISLPQAEAA